MRVVEAHDLTDDARALVPSTIWAVAAVPHGVQDAAVDRLQSVAHIGQRTPDDDAHRVVEVGLLDLVLEVDRVHSPVAGGLQVVVERFFGNLFVSHSKTSQMSRKRTSRALR